MPDSKRNKDGSLCGVCCTAIGCQYHNENDCCCAQEIQVGNAMAMRSGETYCHTFVPRKTQK